MGGGASEGRTAVHQRGGRWRTRGEEGGVSEARMEGGAPEGRMEGGTLEGRIEGGMPEGRRVARQMRGGWRVIGEYGGWQRSSGGTARALYIDARFDWEKGIGTRRAF
jgi:hypothetical protein